MDDFYILQIQISQGNLQRLFSVTFWPKIKDKQDKDAFVTFS